MNAYWEARTTWPFGNTPKRTGSPLFPRTRIFRNEAYSAALRPRSFGFARPTVLPRKSKTLCEQRCRSSSGSSTKRKNHAWFSDRARSLNRLGRFWPASYYRARYYDPSTGRFLSEDPARLEPNAFAYAANSPVDFTDPTGLTKGIPTDCEELRKYIEELYRIFIVKEDQYDPVEDGSGEIPKSGGGLYAPGIHYQNLIFLQLKLLKSLKQWDDTCGGRNNPPPVCDPERVKQPIPAPVFRKPTVTEATGAAAAAYIPYRVLRFLPSLYPPLWWTIPENLALP